jgi:hypothetical protein
MLKCFSFIQYQNDLRSQIITWKILFNFTYEAVVEPVHKHSAVNPSLFVCKPKDWKAIFILALYNTKVHLSIYEHRSQHKFTSSITAKWAMRSLAALNSEAAMSVLCMICELASVCRRAVSHQH